jgi:hypothetical protein
LISYKAIFILTIAFIENKIFGHENKNLLEETFVFGFVDVSNMGYQLRTSSTK